MRHVGRKSVCGLGGLLQNAEMETTWLGARLPFRYFSSSSNDAIAITNNNGGSEKSPEDQGLPSSSTGFIDPEFWPFHHAALLLVLLIFFCFVLL